MPPRKPRSKTMRTAVLNSAAMASVILLSSLFHSKSALADGFPAPSFAAARMFDVGLRPFSAIVNDFNGENKLDLVVANEGSHPDHDGGGVSVFLGKGDGTFQAGANYAGTNLSTVTAGDLNGDSKPDLIVAYADGRVSMLLGNGDGTFQAGSNSRAGTNPVFVAGSDFNNDGKLDLAIAHLGSPGSVSVLLSKGDGTFQAGATYAVGAQLVTITVGDFNRDGKLDLALANGPSTSCGGLGCVTTFDARVSVLSGKGNGTFEPAAAYNAGVVPASLAAGDFNGDGNPDLIEVDGYASVVLVMLGNGDGTLQAAANYDVGSYPASVAEGDFNSDGKPDLAVANLANISVLMGKDDGTLQTPVNYSAGSQPVSVAVG